jgi:MSHA biogenesis protein MshQ
LATINVSTPETVGLTPALTAPLDCDGNPLNDPDCAKPAVSGSFGAFANGSAAATNLSWDEVGIITLTPGVSDGDYLGAGSVAGTVTGKVGRFYPHHFDTEVSAACAAGSFTYSGQPFPFKAIARNAAGGKTSNYEGDFARVGTYSDANGAIGAFSPATLPKATYVDGEADLSAPPSLTFSFTSAANADRVPVVLKPRLTDTDGASSATGTEQTTPLRWGRLRMQNALGAELLRLPMPLTAEYYTAGGWVQNADDVCTTLAVPVAGACAATCVWGDITISNPRGNLAVNETNPSLVDGNAGLANFQPRRGNFGLRLSAPGAGNSGRVTVTTAAPAYLRYDWDHNGSHDNDPSAVATFGVNKSNFIFMREGY